MMKLLDAILGNGKKECNVILSAGGVRCLAQIGALQALEEDGWTIKSVCGISAGSIVAAMYAYGVPLDKMKEIGIATDFTKYKKANFKNIKKGMFKMLDFGKWVWDCCVTHGDCEQMKCELNIGACSITTGNKIIFTNPKKEELQTAIEATCCIPLLFEPVKIGDEYYADGALWSSAPIHFYLDSKLPTFVIHMQNSHTVPFTNYGNPIQLLYRIFEVFQINRLKSLKKRVYDKPVYIIEPSAEGVSALAFKLESPVRRKMIESAKEETLSYLEEHNLDGKKYSLF